MKKRYKFVVGELVYFHGNPMSASTHQPGVLGVVVDADELDDTLGYRIDTGDGGWWWVHAVSIMPINDLTELERLYYGV